MCNIPNFLIDADNVYRTKHFIVKQILILENSTNQDNSIMSYDTFYKRTKKRDKEFDMCFNCKSNQNGKRLPSTMFQRKYID